MKIKLLLLVLAIIGTIMGWMITDSFIISIGLGQFLLIELIITVFHGLYNIAKRDVIKKS
jgi:hypothetical protein